MMRSSVEPMRAMPHRIPFTRPPAQRKAALSSGLEPFPAPTPKKERDLQVFDPVPVVIPVAPPVDHLHRPPVSTSSDENAGRNSDIFSVGENSDTISDPGMDSAERNLQDLPQRPSSPHPQEPPREGASPMVPYLPTTTEPGADVMPQLRPFGLDRQGSVPVLGPDPADDTSAVQLMPRRPYDPAAPIPPAYGIECICRGVPDFLLRILDEMQSVDVNTLTKLYGACRDDLCPLHLNAYAKLITSALEGATPAPEPMAASPRPTVEEEQVAGGMGIQHAPTLTGSSTKWTTVPVRRRATSTPGIYEFELQLPAKRRRTAQESCQPGLNGTSRLPQDPWLRLPPEAPRPSHPTEPEKTGRPIIDVERDENFRQQVIFELVQGFTDTKEDDWLRGETTNRLVHTILSKCQHPNTDPAKGPVDADLFNGEEALQAMERGTQKRPMFTEGQQQFRWNDNDGRPIEQLFQRMEILSRHVSVQVPSRSFDTTSFDKKSLGDIKSRFLRNAPSEDPWNILDLRSPLPHSILPSFLTGENCQLLPRIRDFLLEGHSAERTKASREEWNEWTELLEWVLVSEGGHNTSPHMDSHGWSTWITIQEGEFGFGWLSRPTDEEQNAWIANPLSYTGGNWRFVVLRPGQTVFFPTGTVHFVFRVRAQQTLAVGGHLLQWTALERWAQVILLQLKNPDTTNEDLGMAPLKYIESANEMVKARMHSSRVEALGGMSNVLDFMALAAVSSNRRQRLGNKLRLTSCAGGSQVVQRGGGEE